MPCYLVTDKTAKDGEPKGRLVEANNSAAARNHVTRDRFDVKQASPHDIASIVKGGGEIEVAAGGGHDVQQELPPTPASETPPNDDPPEEAKKASKARGEQPAE
jgi:hypothetical protein